MARYVFDFRPVEDQLQDDLLHPGRAGLGVCGHDDVILAEGKSVPGGGVP
jgi:hypothetical protein